MKEGLLGDTLQVSTEEQLVRLRSSRAINARVLLVGAIGQSVACSWPACRVGVGGYAERQT
jgi:hypothetical protein